MNISFRPHHFLCTLGFQGKGYSAFFIHNFAKIKETLQQNEDLPITVVAKTDSICGPCLYKRAAKCTKEEKIQGLDQRHAHILGIKAGDILSWKEGKNRLKERMTLGAFHQACRGCSWKPLGVCERALQDLKVHDKKALA